MESKVSEGVMHLLTRYVSRLTAQSALTHACHKHGADHTTLTAAQFQAVLPSLKVGLSIWVQPNEIDVLHAELLALGQGRAPEAAARAGQLPPGETIAVREEQDLTLARQAARSLASKLGSGPVSMQKLVTAVSELARNVLLYTEGGVIEIKALAGPPATILVHATDHGPGIKNLDEILAGRHRSRTGLGRGLLGVKRLAERFQVKTGEGGTSVRVEFTI